MKQFSLLIVSLLAVIFTHSQPTNSAVTITILGNKNLQLHLDGKIYSLPSSTTTGETTSVLINNLAVGKHSFQVDRTDLNTNRTARITGEFNLRPGFDLEVNVNQDASLEFIETRVGSTLNLIPISTASFNTLLRNVRLQKSITARNNLITTAFNTNKNSFSTNQVRQLLALVNSESQKLQLAKLSYKVIDDRGNFYQLYNLLSSTASRNELTDYVFNFENGSGSIGNAMSDANFNSLYQTIQQQWPVSAQVTSLTNAFNNTQNYFTSYQAGRLIQLVSSESSRLQLAKLSYRSIIDRNNFYQVSELLNSQSSRNELQGYVNNYDSGTSSGSAMTDVNFNSLYQTIQQQWPVSAQMTSLTNAFNNTAHFFTTYQAGRLIQLIGAESNRLQLAKLSYRGIIDRENFYQVAELLNSQAGKTELEDFVNNYNSGNTGTTGSAMSDANFNSLYQTIQQQWPVSTQVTSLTNAFNNTSNYFTSYQAGRLIQLVNAESNRLVLAKLSYRSIIDKNNFYQVSELLNTQASRNELQAFVNGYAGGTETKTPMSDSDFTLLFNAINAQYLPFEQMTSITNTFNNPNYFFTSAQVKLLIPLVSLESNRLQLAKLSYRSVTDKANFITVYDVLNSQSSKDQLDAYVKAYKE